DCAGGGLPQAGGRNRGGEHTGRTLGGRRDGGIGGRLLDAERQRGGGGAAGEADVAGIAGRDRIGAGRNCGDATGEIGHTFAVEGERVGGKTGRGEGGAAVGKRHRAGGDAGVALRATGQLGGADDLGIEEDEIAIGGG